MTALVGALVAATVGAGLGAAAAWQWQITHDGAIDAVGWAAGLVTIGVASGAGVLATRLLLGMLIGPTSVGADDIGSGARGDRLAALVFTAWLAWTAVLALQLVFDARYRDVAWPMLAAAAVVVLAWRVAGGNLRRDAREERALAVLLAVAAPLIAWQEGSANTQAWSAVLACAGAAASAWWPPGHDRRDRQDASFVLGLPARTQASSASTAAGADHPAP